MLPVAQAGRLIADGYTADQPAPCVCRTPQADHAGGQHTGANPASGCRRYRPSMPHVLAARALAARLTDPIGDIDTYLARAYPRPKVPRPGWGVGPSDTGTCRKRIQLRERPPEGMKLDDVDSSAATLGSIIHDVLGRARSCLYPWRLYEHSVPIPGLDRYGRIDEYDPVTRTAVDYKTRGAASWEWLGNDGADPAEWEQLLIYALALIAQGHPVEWLELLYIARADGDVERFRVRYDPERAERALDKLRAINVALDMGADLPRDRSGPSSDKICEKYCPVRTECWSMNEAAAAGRSPESFTILGPDPEFEQIEWAAGLALTWKQHLAEAKTENENARTLLTGIPGGVYGDVEVIERSRNVTDWNAWARAIRDALNIGATAEQLQMIKVPKRRDRWVEVKPVRAAQKQGAA